MGAMMKHGKSQETHKAQTGLEEKKKGRGVFGGLFLRAAERVGIIEQTRLAPEFEAEVDKYMKYQEVVDELVEKLESCVQLNPRVLAKLVIEAPEKEDPYELFAQAVKHFRHSLPEDRKPPMVVVEAIAKRLALINRENQLQSRRTIRKLRRFVSSGFETILEDQKRLMAARDLVDSARHDVKQSRTIEDVEQKGRIYEQAVHEFDVLAEKIMLACENLSQEKLAHQRGVLDAQNHKHTAQLLKEHLNRLGVQSAKQSLTSS